MKIAIFCPSYPPALKEGGIAHYTQLLAHHIAPLVGKVTIVTNQYYNGTGNDGPISIIQFTEPWDWLTARKIRLELKARSVDLVNLQYSPVMYSTRSKFMWPFIAQRFASTISFHTLWGGSKINYLAAMWLLATASGMIATNSEVLYLTRKFFPFYHRKARLIPIGPNIAPQADKKAYAEISKKHLPDINGPLLVHFGMPYPGKGVKALLKATQVLKNEYRLDIHLVVIGGGVSESSTYVQKRKNMAAALGLDDRVIWTGRLAAEAVSALICRGDVVVLPFESGVSDRRGSLMAALAHQKAVVTFRPSIPMPFFKNGVNMVWPDREDAEALAAAICAVLQDKDLRRRLEDGAAELVKHYDWANIALRTRTWFAEISLSKPMG
ncbi:MAG: glycosyltransferase family 4 protein [Desulfobacterales bacterium]|jgi:glycosyltransferase involved in cell wall biosynthesis